MNIQKHTIAVLGGALAAGAVATVIATIATKKAIEKVGDVASDVVSGAVDKAQDVMSINTKLIAVGVGCTAALATAACVNNVTSIAKAGKGVASHIKVPHL